MRRRAASVLLASWLSLALDACASVAPTASPTPGGTLPMLTVTSSAFTEGGEIPPRYSCDGANASPPIAWSDVPDGTVAIALELTDPDAGGFVHWLATDLSPSAGLPEGVSGSASAGVEGTNTFGKRGYGGPCPPSGTHRYRFTVYALSARTGLAAGFGQDALARAIREITLADGTLTARYTRQR